MCSWTPKIHHRVINSPPVEAPKAETKPHEAPREEATPAKTPKAEAIPATAPKEEACAAECNESRIHYFVKPSRTNKIFGQNPFTLSNRSGDFFWTKNSRQMFLSNRPGQKIILREQICLDTFFFRPKHFSGQKIVSNRPGQKMQQNAMKT